MDDVGDAEQPLINHCIEHCSQNLLGARVVLLEACRSIEFYTTLHRHQDVLDVHEPCDEVNVGEWKLCPQVPIYDLDAITRQAGLILDAPEHLWVCVGLLEASGGNA